MKKLLFLLVISIFISSVYAQSNQADSLYQQALKLYDNKDFANAITAFEKVLEINPRHTDALFNLAVLQYDQGNKQKAIDLFQRSAALGDSESKEILKNKLNVRLAYTDTMDVADVDKLPSLIIDNKQEDLFFNKTINTKLLSTIADKIVKSATIKARVFEVDAANKNVEASTLKEVKMKVGLLFGKDGSITAVPVGEDFADRKLIVDLLTVSPQLGKVTPAMYDNKAVCARYYSVPIMFYAEEK
ncbi:hypothetical protein Solca_0660 [Solitalea canadensis DSM 3403]|uniref:Uncharacterized protein n=2 Tax=Solitalea canadensis TaxID=995 RepID=H8KY47_SOLCM|nr:hypothetical protein Solca_0660 [Solitalea canadensis DSM 3403]